MTRYGMAIDMTRCYGCQTCAAACKVANNLPKDLVYNRVLTVGGTSNDCAAGTYPDCTLDFLPMQCQHCDKPACLAVCPTGATQQRDDGIVWVDNELCIGCESCIKACPYEGVRTLISTEPEYYLDVVVGEFDAPHAQGGHGGEVHVLPQPHRSRRGSRLHAAVSRPRTPLGRPRRS